VDARQKTRVFIVNVLIGCEFSGIVRDAFTARGHYAVSCDLLPTESPSPHHEGDVLEYIASHPGFFDLMIAHPPCTYLCNSGVRWLHTEPGRWEKMRQAAKFFRDLLNADIPAVAAENPIMHSYALDIIGAQHNQLIQPWEFGHGETKATCLWFRGLWPLEPTKIVPGRDPRVHHASPGPDRWKERSRTLTGVAAAMANQWGRVKPMHALF
jgi:hypothetical protein